MFSSGDKISRHSQVQHKAAEPAAFLQRKADNPFFGTKQSDTFFPPATIQAKLSISQPGDPHEKEADTMAERVMTMPEPSAAAPVSMAQEPARETEKDIQPKEEEQAPMPVTEIARRIQCKEDKDEDKKVSPRLSDNISRKEIDAIDEAKEPEVPALPAMITIDRKIRGPCSPPIIQRQGRAPPTPHHSFEGSLHSTKGSGTPLPDSTRNFMENRFGADFGGVRIHTGSTAIQLNSQVHAQAFTHGNDVYFNAGKYAPHTPEGGLLLAHELTHTLQQGASKTLSPSAIAAKRQTIYRQAADASPPRISNLDAAVNIAKGETGKVDAGATGPDGFRTGWQHLVDYFQTSFGSERILPEGAPYRPNTVNIAHIKSRTTVSGMKPNQPDPTVRENRDAMPSWCGIFVFWALNKAGLPMPKWTLGKAPVNLAAAYPPGYAPRPGDIAYRNKLSHFAMVEKTEGNDVYTINGNTAGENNLGGQVQVKKHTLKEWTAFFDPLYGIDPDQVSAPAAAAEPKTFRELQHELFGTVSRKEEAEETSMETSGAQQTTVQAKQEMSGWSVNAVGQLQPAASATIHTKHEEHTTDNDSPEKEQHDIEGPQPVYSISRMKDTRGPPVQRMVNSSEGNVIQCSLLDNALARIGELLNDLPSMTEGIDGARRWLLGKVRQFASYIPGYRALGVILGYDPITNAGIERNGRNFIEAALDIIPGGSLLQQKLEELGAIERAANWIDTQLAVIEAIVQGVSTEFNNAWNELGPLTILEGPTDVLRNLGGILERAINNIISFAERAAGELLSMVKEYLLTQLVEFVRTQTTAYPLLRVILGKDPVTEEEVPRNGANILNAMLELSEAGREQRTQMQDTGTFDRVANWIDTGIGIFSGAYEQIINGFHNIWNHVSIDSLMDPVGTFQMIYNEFAAPVGRVLDYMAETAIMILSFIKEVLMRRLSAWARTVRGYPLVIVLIGKDPFTDEVVPRSIPNIIRGFMSLMEGGEEQFNQLQESGAIGRTVARINAAVARLNMTPTYIVNLFISLWNSFSIHDLVDPIAAFQRIIDRFGEPIGRLIDFVVEIVKIVVEVILQVMNFPTDLIANIITKAMQAFEMIKRDPVGFLKNLLRAIKRGFEQFFANILTHLMTGLTGWLMSELRDANVPAPADFTLRGIISWVLQVLGISMEAIWQKLAAHPRIGPARVARIRSLINTLEGIWTFIRDVQERGMAAIWERIQEQLTNLWDTVLNAIKSWIMERIINAMVTRLLSMLDPTGIMAVINSAIALYRAVQSFIQYLRQMLEIVNSFVEGVVEIASGNTARAANFLERALARGMPIVIGFLANQVGLGGLGRRISEMITAARQMVDRALTWLVNRAVDTAFAVLDRLLAMGRSAVGAITNWWRERKPFSTENGESHELYFQGEGSGARLILASNNPRQIQEWLSARRTELQAAGRINVRVQRALDAVPGLIQELDQTTHTEAPASGRRPRFVNQILNDLSTNIAIIGVSNNEIPVPPMVVQPGFSDAKAEGTITVNYLYSAPDNHRPGSGTNGREELHGAFPEIERLGVTTNWKRGHLINADFGGMPANSNLIPITTSMNNGIYPAFDNQITTLLNGDTANNIPKQVVWMNIRIQRSHREDPQRLFVSHLTVNAGAMAAQNGRWQIAHDRDVTPINTDIAMPAAPTVRLSINYLIQNRIIAQDQVREVSSNNDIAESLLRALIDRGTVLNNLDEIADFITTHPTWTNYKKSRDLARFNRSRARGRVTL